MKNALLLSSLVGLIGLISLMGLSGTSFSGQRQQTEKTAKKDVPKPDLRIDINSADVVELSKLPGIGKQVAERIVTYRKENGPFAKAEELMNVRGIGEKSFLKLRPYLSLGSDQDKRKKR